MPAADIAAPSRTVKVIGLVSSGHFVSHFYLLLLPPLFPLLRDVYAVGFTELGLAITAFSVVTGLTHAPVGFLVDRMGARVLLIAGMLVESIAIVLIGVFPVYTALIALMMVAGLANAVYHPADYAILNASVGAARMGRAFSVHTFAGYLGGAVAPVSVIYLTTLVGWRAAVVICGLAGCAVALLMAVNSEVLRDAARSGARTSGAVHRGGLRLLLSVPILLGLLFFTGLSMAARGFSHFGVSVLNELYATPLTQAGAVLSAFMFASPLGVLIGGWIADRTHRHAAVNAVCFAGMAAAVFTLAAVELSLASVAVLFAVAGLCNGVLAPSRDMLIRSVTPPGEMGKVFGFVSTGYNIGGICAPALFGYLLDHSEPRMVFWLVGAIALLTLAIVMLTGRQARTRVASLDYS